MGKIEKTIAKEWFFLIMTVVVLLLFTMLIPFPFCLFRGKKYNISFLKMLLIYLVFSCFGFVGACIGSVISGGALIGRRLYGLMIMDTAVLFTMSRFLKIKIGSLGDFVAVPIMAVCFSAKIDCLINDCCIGCIISHCDTQPIRFPSAIFEMAIWGIFVVLLLLIEKKNTMQGTLWPLAMVWFGAARYLVDFLRETQEVMFFTLTAGRFWSLVAMMIGIVYLYIVIYRRIKRQLTIVEFLKAVFGQLHLPAIHRS